MPPLAFLWSHLFLVELFKFVCAATYYYLTYPFLSQLSFFLLCALLDPLHGNSTCGRFTGVSISYTFLSPFLTTL